LDDEEIQPFTLDVNCNDISNRFAQVDEAADFDELELSVVDSISTMQ
jgi:hypothetical protein